MTIQFTVDRWAAWAPGLPDADAWLAWLAEPHALAADGMPALAEMPAMMRRRVDRLGRIALQPAYWGLADAPACAIVFASRHGDSHRTVDLLQQLARGEPLSPTAFSLSVHNAIGALFSIARADATSYTAVACGEETVAAAFVEALGLLAEGQPKVLLVYYDEPLPEPLAHFSAPQEFPRAWACLISQAQVAGISLEALPAPAVIASPAGQDALPDIAALRFLLSDAPVLEQIAGARAWRWQRHA